MAALPLTRPFVRPAVGTRALRPSGLGWEPVAARQRLHNRAWHGIAQATDHLRDLNVAGRNDYSGPTRQLTDQALISGRVNSAACNLTKSCMLIGFWPVSLNRSSVIRS